MRYLRLLTDWTKIDDIADRVLDELDIDFAGDDKYSEEDLYRLIDERAQDQDTATTILIIGDDHRFRMALHLMARQAAAASVSTAKCDDNGDLADADFHLRPNGAPYWRCHHSSGPHCYDSGGGPMSSCP